MKEHEKSITTQKNLSTHDRLSATEKRITPSLSKLLNYANHSFNTTVTVRPNSQFLHWLQI